MQPGRVSLILAGIFISIWASTADAQNCQPVPSACANASNRGQALINGFPRATGIVDGASMAYCQTRIAIEINGFCADQYRAQGRSACADALDQQVAAYKAALPQMRATISDASERRATDYCHFR